MEGCAPKLQVALLHAGAELCVLVILAAPWLIVMRRVASGLTEV